MLNTAPIFVIGFQRGGTNILTNLLASHPDVRTLDRETHQVFYGRRRRRVERWLDRLRYVPILVAARGHVFRPASLHERRALPAAAMRYVDWLLHRNSVSGGQGRLVAKNVNGLAFATPVFEEMYPDATFVALMRNGLALCESYLRRGWRADAFGAAYERICNRVLEDAATRPRYRIVRFEDLITDPAAVIRWIYRSAALDPDRVQRFRLQAKQSMDRDGQRRYTFGGEQDRETRWFAPEELGRCFRRDVNENQIARLPEAERQRFLQQARGSMARLGYL